MQIQKTNLEGVVVIEPKVFGDERGFFMETWNQARYTEMLGVENFVQDNLSFSKKGVLRGLHFQTINPQGKLVSVLQGEVFDVAVDIRVGSPTFGQWTSVILSAENKKQFYVPPGFGHGFCVISETALFAYKCTDIYNPKGEGCVLWNDPDLNISWSIDNPELSEKDIKGIKLADFSIEHLPQYTA